MSFLNPDEAYAILRKFGAITTNTHVRLASGQHTDTYVNMCNFPENSSEFLDFCIEIAERVSDENVDIIASPSGVAFWITHYIATTLNEFQGRPEGIRNTLPIEVHYIPPVNGGESSFALAPHSANMHDCRILVVADSLTTGAALRKVIDLMREYGGTVIGLAVFCNFGDLQPKDLDVPYIISILDLKIETWPPETCPLCARGDPIALTLGKPLRP